MPSIKIRNIWLHTKSINQIGINENNLFSFVDNKLTQCPDDDFNKLIRFLKLKNGLTENFIKIPECNYSEQIRSIEEIVTVQMAFKVDKRIVDFLENYRTDARILSDVISKKQRFDKADFEKLKNSFPCILAKKVWSWLQETAFFKANSSFIEVQAQFPLGEYLKQLDKRYSHPLYVVDFLLIYTDKEQRVHKIILEYDGFEYHFQNCSMVDSSNYGEYYTEDHVYREKVLESYGYNFLRINRFNVGKNPIEILNQRLENLVKKNSNKITP